MKAPPPLNDVLSPMLLARSASIDTTQARPHLAPSTTAHRFAVLVLAGFSFNEAADIVGIKRRWAVQLRTDLMNQALLYFGQPTSYTFAARYALDPQLREICLRLHSECSNAQLNRIAPLPDTGNQP